MSKPAPPSMSSFVSSSRRTLAFVSMRSRRAPSFCSINSMSTVCGIIVGDISRWSSSAVSPCARVVTKLSPFDTTATVPTAPAARFEKRLRKSPPPMSGCASRTIVKPALHAASEVPGRSTEPIRFVRCVGSSSTKMGLVTLESSLSSADGFSSVIVRLATRPFSFTSYPRSTPPTVRPPYEPGTRQRHSGPYSLSSGRTWSSGGQMVKEPLPGANTSWKSKKTDGTAPHAATL